MTLLWSLWLGWTCAGMYLVVKTLQEIRDTHRRISVETLEQSRIADMANDYRQELYRGLAFFRQDFNAATDFTHECLQKIADAQVDRRNWALEDRENRSIDDFPLITPPADEPARCRDCDRVLPDHSASCLIADGPSDPNGTQIPEEKCPYGGPASLGLPSCCRLEKGHAGGHERFPK